MARTLFCGVAALALGAVAEPLQFGDGPLGLTFAPEADGYGIRRIENRLGAVFGKLHNYPKVQPVLPRKWAYITLIS